MSFADNRGVRIHYEVEGRGLPLVLHHGYSENLRTWYWKDFVKPLQDDYQLILIDIRGHGASDKPHESDAYGLEQYAMDVVAVLDVLELDQAHCFGYSLGGWIGFALAKHAPDRLLSLTIGGVSPYGSSLTVYRNILKTNLESCLTSLEKAFGARLPDEVRQDHFSNDIHALRAAYQHDRPDISAILPSMTIPCLLFAGEADPLYDAIKRCATELPKAVFLSLSGLNHIQVALHLKRVLPHLIKFLAAI